MIVKEGPPRRMHTICCAVCRPIVRGWMRTAMRSAPALHGNARITYMSFRHPGCTLKWFHNDFQRFSSFRCCRQLPGVWNLRRVPPSLHRCADFATEQPAASCAQQASSSDCDVFCVLMTAAIALGCVLCPCKLGPIGAHEFRARTSRRSSKAPTPWRATTWFPRGRLRLMNPLRCPPAALVVMSLQRRCRDSCVHPARCSVQESSTF